MADVCNSAAVCAEEWKVAQAQMLQNIIFIIYMSYVCGHF